MFWVRNFHDHWEALLDAIGGMPPEAEDPLREMEAQACLHRLLVRLLDRPARLAPSSRLALALERAEDGKASVPELSRAAGCSVATLHRFVTGELGESPAA